MYPGRTAVALCDVPAHGHAARSHDTTRALRLCEPLLVHTHAARHSQESVPIHDPFKFKLDYVNLKYLIECESFRFTTWRDVRSRAASLKRICGANSASDAEAPQRRR